jgi:hypothetical protein
MVDAPTTAIVFGRRMALIAALSTFFPPEDGYISFFVSSKKSPTIDNPGLDFRVIVILNVVPM